MRALFLLEAEKMKDEFGCYACYFPSICEIWNDMIVCWQLRYFTQIQTCDH